MTFEVGRTYPTADGKGTTFMGYMPSGRGVFYSQSVLGSEYSYTAHPDGRPIDGTRGKSIIQDKISEMFS